MEPLGVAWLVLGCDPSVPFKPLLLLLSLQPSVCNSEGNPEMEMHAQRGQPVWGNMTSFMPFPPLGTARDTETVPQQPRVAVQSWQLQMVPKQRHQPLTTPLSPLHSSAPLILATSFLKCVPSSPAPCPCLSGLPRSSQDNCSSLKPTSRFFCF